MSGAVSTSPVQDAPPPRSRDTFPGCSAKGLSWESHQRSHKVTWLRASTAPSPGSHVTGATWRWRKTAACLRSSHRHRRRDLELDGHNGYLTFDLLLGRGLMAQAENLVTTVSTKGQVIL